MFKMLSAIVPSLLACVLLTLADSQAAASTLFSDDFDSGASPLWGNEVGAWTDAGGVYKASTPDNFPNAYSSLPFDLSDFTLNVDVNSVGDGGIWLRSAPAPGSPIGIQGVLLVTLGGNLYWHVVADGSTYGSSLNLQSGGYAAGSSPSLRVEVAGDTYSVYANGSPTPTTSVVTGLFPSGSVALYDNSSAQSFDNVVLEAVPEPAAACLAALAAATLAIAPGSRRS